jgi:hypothetical protein
MVYLSSQFPAHDFASPGRENHWVFSIRELRNARVEKITGKDQFLRSYLTDEHGKLRA